MYYNLITFWCAVFRLKPRVAACLIVAQFLQLNLQNQLMLKVALWDLYEMYVRTSLSNFIRVSKEEKSMHLSTNWDKVMYVQHKQNWFEPKSVTPKARVAEFMEITPLLFPGESYFAQLIKSQCLSTYIYIYMYIRIALSFMVICRSTNFPKSSCKKRKSDKKTLSKMQISSKRLNTFWKVPFYSQK